MEMTAAAATAAATVVVTIVTAGGTAVAASAAAAANDVYGDYGGYSREASQLDTPGQAAPHTAAAPASQAAAYVEDANPFARRKSTGAAGGGSGSGPGGAEDEDVREIVGDDRDRGQPAGGKVKTARETNPAPAKKSKKNPFAR
mmetsp:Transcript_16376/g.40262  ORF Transcript_16376/g.40262 Transcript_16376/m.40262 type:complete len:144 (+) Transcript_16376:1615-2046(+)